MNARLYKGFAEYAGDPAWDVIYAGYLLERMEWKLDELRRGYGSEYLPSMVCEKDLLEGMRELRMRMM